ncbi:MAG: methyl-accepting chemotaxis protein [Alteromonadaceae bacterium]
MVAGQGSVEHYPVDLTRYFNNLSLKIKLSFLPALLIVIMILMNFNTYLDLKDIKSTTELTSEVYAKEVKVASSIMQNTLERQSLIYQYLKSGDAALVEQFNLKKDQLLMVKKQLAEIANYDSNGTDNNRFSQIAALNSDINRVFINELVPGKQMIIATTNRLVNETTPSMIQEINSIVDLAELEEFTDIQSTAVEMVASIMTANSSMQNYILTQGSSDSDRFDFQIEAAQSLHDDLLDMIESEEFSEYMTATKQLLATFADEFTQIRRHFATNKQVIETKLEVDVATVLELILQLQKNVWTGLDKNGDEVSDNIDQINGSNLIIAMVLTLFSSLVMVFLVNKITKPLAEMLATMADMAAGEGDISRRLTVHSKDEVGQLANEFNQFLNKLHTIITQLSNTVEALLKSSQSVSSEMKQCEQGVSLQRTETDMVSVAINEMATTSIEVSRSATSTLTTIQEAETSVQEGEKAVGSTFNDINDLAKNIDAAAECTHELAEQSANVAEILNAIHGITEQTNLLALNAAIEAARAGEHGRGFAVVADAVRELAKRTHESTDQIAKIIEALQIAASRAESMMGESNGQAKRCVEDMSQVQGSLGAITQAFFDINGQMTQVATAMEEQAATAEEVNRNVVKINDISTQNLNSIERSSNESNDLLSQAHGLTDIVSEFKL